MKPYTLDQVLALPDGAEICFEFHDKGEPELHDFKAHAPMECLIGAFGSKALEEYGVFWRVWPTRPTDAEREAEAWE